MDNFYYEVCFTPNVHLELFENFLIEQTGEGVERCDDTIILRSLDDPTELIKTTKIYCQNLSEIFKSSITCEITMDELENMDWVEAYKKGFTPLSVGSFYLHASWHESHPTLQNIIIDPELVFGTGHHATTQVALNALEKYLKPKKSFVDVGTGSGILAIAAAKMGAKVDLCDIDPDAVLDAPKNFAKNEVEYNAIWEGSLHKSPEKKYDFIIANIVADVLLSLKGQFYTYLDDDGILVVSGILDKHLERIQEAYKKFEEIEHLHIGEWHSLVFKKKED